MSSNTNNNNNNNNANKDNNNNKVPELPELLPDLKEARSSISKGIRWMVDSTNTALAKLQTTADAVRRPLNSSMETLEHTGTQVATTARITYERRHEFGPYWVMGSFVSVASLFALQRGKVTGVVLGSLAASLTYVALYEPMAETPTLDWPFPNWTRNYNNNNSGSSGDKKE